MTPRLHRTSDTPVQPPTPDRGGSDSSALLLLPDRFALTDPKGVLTESKGILTEAKLILTDPAEILTMPILGLSGRFPPKMAMSGQKSAL
jgi:hypothetical protein